MGIKHSNVRTSLIGERANSGGLPRTQRTDAGSSVDIDGVPHRWTNRVSCEYPEGFWAELRATGDATAAAKNWGLSE